MFIGNCSLRVRYGETDQMGVVYYGNYAQYFEVGRVETLRRLGMTYREMEDKGVMLPVLKLEVKYIRPAKYDDLLTIKTEIREMPASRITFHHEIYSEHGELLTVGMVQLAFVDMKTGKVRRAPKDLLEKIRSGGKW